MLIELIGEREEERVRESLTHAAFIAWQLAQDEWNTMFQQSAFQAQSKQQGKRIQEQHQKWINDYPGFRDYLRKLGILKDD